MDRDELVPQEIEVLRILNGEDVPEWSWGAAMAVCCEHLKGCGYAKDMYEISDKGKKYLDNLH
jgi:hypothetical protein